MRIVVPKETHPLEKRVMVLPKTAQVLVESGHKVFVQAGAGSGINIPDERYKKAGATIISEAIELYKKAAEGMIIKVKSPSREEFSFMTDSILFCMLHIEQNKERIYYLGSQDLVGVAMEDITNERGQRLVDQTHETGLAGVYYSIQHFQKLPEHMRAVILGYGNVANGAIAACSKLGITYKIMRKRELRRLPLWLADCDLLINAIAWPEKQREKKEYLVTRQDIRDSNPGMIVLDLSVDFPNPIETVHFTTYQNPFYIEEDRIHISIYGYPGLMPVSSSEIYSEQVLPLALAIADNGGLSDIRKVEGVGPFIARGVVDLQKYGDWREYEPLTSPGSKIE